MATESSASSQPIFVSNFPVIVSLPEGLGKLELDVPATETAVALRALLAEHPMTVPYTAFKLELEWPIPNNSLEEEAKACQYTAEDGKTVVPAPSFEGLGRVVMTKEGLPLKRIIPLPDVSPDLTTLTPLLAVPTSSIDGNRGGEHVSPSNLPYADYFVPRGTVRMLIEPYDVKTAKQHVRRLKEALIRPPVSNLVITPEAAAEAAARVRAAEGKKGEKETKDEKESAASRDDDDTDDYENNNESSDKDRPPPLPVPSGSGSQFLSVLMRTEEFGWPGGSLLRRQRAEIVAIRKACSSMAVPPLPDGSSALPFSLADVYPTPLALSMTEEVTQVLTKRDNTLAIVAAFLDEAELSAGSRKAQGGAQLPAEKARAAAAQALLNALPVPGAMKREPNSNVSPLTALENAALLAGPAATKQTVKALEPQFIPASVASHAKATGKAASLAGTITPSGGTLPQCVRSIAFNGWNPPPAPRKMAGDLLYLTIYLLDSPTPIGVTGTTTGFYVNRCRDPAADANDDQGVFDPTPASPSFSSRTLWALLSRASPAFKRNYQALLNAAAEAVNSAVSTSSSGWDAAFALSLSPVLLHSAVTGVPSSLAAAATAAGLPDPVVAAPSSNALATLTTLEADSTPFRDTAPASTFGMAVVPGGSFLFTRAPPFVPDSFLPASPEVQKHKFNHASAALDNEDKDQDGGRRLSGSVHGHDAMRAEDDALCTFGMSTGTRDWNEEFTAVRSMPCSTLSERVARARAVIKVVSAFTDAAVHAVVAVVNGLVTPLNPTEHRSQHVFVFNSLFMTPATPSFLKIKEQARVRELLMTGKGKKEDMLLTIAIPFVPEDLATSSAIQNDLHGVAAIHRADVPELNTLASCVVTYQGQAFFVQSVIPGIMSSGWESRLIYGSVDSGATLANKDKAMIDKMRTLGKALGIAERPFTPFGLSASSSSSSSSSSTSSDAHTQDEEANDAAAAPVRTSGWLSVSSASTEPGTCVGPVEAKGIYGSDGRHYLLDFVRITPKDPVFYDVLYDALQGATDIAPDFDVLKLLEAQYEEGEKAAAAKEAEGEGQALVQLAALDAIGDTTRALEVPVIASASSSSSSSSSRPAPGLELVDPESDFAKRKDSELYGHTPGSPPLAFQVGLEHAHVALMRPELLKRYQQALRAHDAKLKEGQSTDIVHASSESSSPGASVPASAVADEPLAFNTNVFTRFMAQLPSDLRRSDEASVRSVARFLHRVVIPHALSLLRGVNGPADGDELTRDLHALGLNVRHFGLLAAKIAQEEADGIVGPHVLELLETEMVARTARQLLNAALRDESCKAAPAVTVSIFLNLLLGAPTTVVSGGGTGSGAPGEEEGSSSASAFAAKKEKAGKKESSSSNPETSLITLLPRPPQDKDMALLFRQSPLYAPAVKVSFPSSDTSLPADVAAKAAKDIFGSSHAHFWAELRKQVYVRFRYRLRLWTNGGFPVPGASATPPPSSASAAGNEDGEALLWSQQPGSPARFQRCHRLPLLRRLCQKTGVQMVARAYNFPSAASEAASASLVTASSSKQTSVGKKATGAGVFSPADVAGVAPVIKSFLPSELFPEAMEMMQKAVEHLRPPKSKERKPRTKLVQGDAVSEATCRAEEAYERADDARERLRRFEVAEAACAQCNEALLLLFQVLGVNHQDVAEACALAAQAISGAGEAIAAAQHQQRGVVILERVYGPDSLETAAAHRRLASYFSSGGVPNAAIRHYLRALIILSLAAPPSHPRIGLLISELGFCFKMHQHMPAAKACFAAASRYKVRADPLFTASWLTGLALANAAFGQLSGAISLQLKLVHFYASLGLADFADDAKDVLSNMVAAHKRIEEAKEKEKADEAKPLEDAVSALSSAGAGGAGKGSSSGGGGGKKRKGGK